VAATPTAARTWESRQVILDRNLFNVSTLAPIDTAPVEEDLAATKLPLRLLGTAAAGSAALSWAAVEDLENRDHVVVRIDDSLKKAQVVRIERGRIVLRNGGRLEELALEDEAQGGATPSGSRDRNARATQARASRPNANKSAASRVRRLAENRYEVNKDTAEEVAGNPASLFSQARILPKYVDGQMVGVQLNAIKSGSLFEEIGIENGDTIIEFNGIRIQSQQDSTSVLRELADAKQFNVTVTGNDGEERELTYELR
jgi:general secretion pathway protein C